MNPALIRLAHTGLNPDRLRRLVHEAGADGAVRRLRSDTRTNAVARSGLDVDPSLRLDRLQAMGVEFVAAEDERFPPELRRLPDHPLWLFVRGELPRTGGVAVVGSRRATRYGLELAETMSSRIAAAGWTVISGLAAGIDTAAHRGALQGDGDTVAVLGSGIDVWYPRRNRGLGEQIIDSGGGVVSEFPPGTTPEPWRFPARNRIISGLSEVVIVVEAAARSGALITARLALEHGRFVMAVPGDLSRETSMGANLLIRDGAHPLTEMQALVEELELVLGPAPLQPAEPTELATDPLLDLIGDGSFSFDELADRTGVPIGTLLSELTRLELAGRVTLANGFVRSV